MTLPVGGDTRGRLHLITQIRREVEDVFLGLGYSVVDGREVETTRYNFDALNFPAGHPARSPLATLFLDDETVLRTETSPSQIRTMEVQEPPVYIVTLGRVYRRDTPDATHTPVFHQVEGPRRRRRDHARRSRGHARLPDARALRPGTQNRVPHALLPVHRAFDRGVRLVPRLRRQRVSGVPPLGLDRGGRRRDGRSRSSSSSSATTPSATPASPSAGASSALPCSATSSRTSASCGATTSASRGSFEDPALLAPRVRRDVGDRRGDRPSPHRLGARDRAARSRSASRTKAATWGTSSSGASSAPSRTRTPTGSSSARSTSATPTRSRSSAARGTSVRARPSRSVSPARSCPASRARSPRDRFAARSRAG